MESASCAIQERVGSLSLRFGASSIHTPDRASIAARSTNDEHDHEARTQINRILKYATRSAPTANQPPHLTLQQKCQTDSFSILQCTDCIVGNES